MANPVLLQKRNGQHLWFALLGLGFQPDVEASYVVGKVNIKHLNIGPNMFDKPNKDAFYIVTHFLLEKLNPTRFHEAYRHCWPVLDHKVDAEFRKVTCAWLREIMDETANAGSKVVASLFLSPGGPKFTSLMLHLAKHTMLQEMKTFTTDDTWVPEAIAVPASTLDMAVKRFNLIRTRFLKAAVDQDCFLQAYQRRAQHLVKSMRDIKADGTKYDELLKRHSSDAAQDEAYHVEKIKKVRSLWSDIERMLSTIKEEQSAVESVLKGEVDQYVLDGTDRVLKIPSCLLERIERLPHQLTSGNVYEAGQLNLLCVMELMNHAVQLLKEERCRVSSTSESRLSPQLLQEKSQQMARVLQDLHLIRQKISKEEIPEIKSTISELEANWDKRWMDMLKDTPLVSFLNEDPALGFLSPMAPLSFEPAAEATYRSTIFSQYPAKLLEEKPTASDSQEVVNHGDSNRKSSCPAKLKASESPVVTVEARANTSLDWLFDTPPSPSGKAPSAPTPQSAAVFQTTSSMASMRKTSHRKVAPMRTKTQILELEYDNLADQFADAITTTTPKGSVKDIDLQCLLNTLQRDPFSTRKQLHRTPESLIMDVKSSWRKAVEEDEAKKLRQSAEVKKTLTGQLGQPHNSTVSPDSRIHTVSFTTPVVTSQDSPSVCQQGVLLNASLSWDTFNAEVLDTPSGTGSSAVLFSLDHETLPEMASCESLILDDEAVDMRSEEDEELAIPSQSLLTARHLGQIQQASNDGALESVRTTERFLSDYEVSALDWRTEPAASEENTEKLFSLDLDSLKTPSPPKKQEYSLPKLITFSPIDDMKC
ncbi:HAUS augmin-like complex subunit 6 [Melanotaenia boesemani]|uniref:HAUS augmin-like complex subunit 6 n=1 Tax=Melanotaenia boesemani TaxID=1250792 RepID=UPI001C0520ED|nr:HAUS augmin-like complex subunit 6 [Melanotaenia boesemani]